MACSMIKHKTHDTTRTTTTTTHPEMMNMNTITRIIATKHPSINTSTTTRALILVKNYGSARALAKFEEEEVRQTTRHSINHYYYRCRCRSIPSVNAINTNRSTSTSINTRARRFSSLVKNKSKSEELTSSDGVVAFPIDFDVASRVEGQESQIVTVDLEPGQVLRAESGAMLYMTEGIEMETTAGGGLSAGFKRMLTGQNLMISDFRYTGAEGTKGAVALGTDFPSKIVRLSVDDYGGKIVCQKGALLCASHTIDIEMEFAKKMTAGFFGGEGFVLQSLTGSGDVFVKAGGTLIRRDLKDGEVLRVSSGCLVAFVDGVQFDVQMMQGFKNVVFGGEGLFVTTLTGPGTIWLQGQPPQRMISEIARRVPSGGGMGFAIPMGGMGGGSGEGAGDVEDDGENVDSESSDFAASSPTDESSAGVGAANEAIENDRAYTSASSITGSNSVDSESPSALFGDAADTSKISQSTSFSEESSSSSFSTQDESNFAGNDDQFAKDETVFSTFESSENEESGGGVLSDLWDMIKGD